MDVVVTKRGTIDNGQWTMDVFQVNGLWSMVYGHIVRADERPFPEWKEI